MTISKEKRSILTAALSVGLAVLLLSYSAYGWFVSTRAVTANEIKLQLSAPKNIQISLVGDNDNRNWSDTVGVDVIEVLKKQLGIAELEKSNLYILPASSLAGFENTFFATVQAEVGGAASQDAVFTDGTPVHKLQENYEGHYVDIPLFFRNQGEESVTLALDKSIVGEGETTTAITSLKLGNAISNIARVAFLSPDKLKNSMNETTPIVLSGDNAVAPKVLTGKDFPKDLADSKYIQFDDTTKLSNENIIKVDPAIHDDSGTTYQVVSLVARIWIEGQDEKCTVAVGNQSFTVDLKFSVK